MTLASIERYIQPSYRILPDFNLRTAANVTRERSNRDDKPTEPYEGERFKLATILFFAPSFALSFFLLLFLFFYFDCRSSFLSTRFSSNHLPRDRVATESMLEICCRKLDATFPLDSYSRTSTCVVCGRAGYCDVTLRN